MISQAFDSCHAFQSAKTASKISFPYIYMSFDLHPIEPGVQHVYSAHRKLMRFVTTSSNHKQPLETSGNPARTGHVHVQSRTM